MTEIKVRICGDRCEIISIKNALTLDEVKAILGELKSQVYLDSRRGPSYYLVEEGKIKRCRPDIWGTFFLEVGQVYSVSDFNAIISELRDAGQRFADLHRLELETKTYLI